MKAINTIEVLLAGTPVGSWWPVDRVSTLPTGVWGATQWTAAALGYQARLGAPWFELLDTPVYHPWRLFEWWFVFDA